MVQVPPGAAGLRLDRFLATVPELGTRSRAKSLIDGGLVRVDGTPRKSAHVLRAGQEIAVAVPPPEPAGVAAEPLPLVVLYEDAHLLAIDKAQGMVGHPAPGARHGTVVNALLQRVGALDGVGDPERPGIVDRLDRDTSGAARRAHATALRGLARQFHDRTLSKRYVAVVHGVLRAAAGVIDQAIGRHPQEHTRACERVGRARRAESSSVSVARPCASRRRPAAPTSSVCTSPASRHPIVADRLYGGGRRASGATAGGARSRCPRRAPCRIHAFAHPATGPGGRPVAAFRRPGGAARCAPSHRRRLDTPRRFPYLRRRGRGSARIPIATRLPVTPVRISPVPGARAHGPEHAFVDLTGAEDAVVSTRERATSDATPARARQGGGRGHRARRAAAVRRAAGTGARGTCRR